MAIKWKNTVKKLPMIVQKEWKDVYKRQELNRVPTFLSFRGGKVKGAVTGVVTKKVLEGLF